MACALLSLMYASLCFWISCIFFIFSIAFPVTKAFSAACSFASLFFPFCASYRFLSFMYSAQLTDILSRSYLLTFLKKLLSSIMLATSLALVLLRPVWFMRSLCKSWFISVTERPRMQVCTLPIVNFLAVLFSDWRDLRVWVLFWMLSVFLEMSDKTL